MESVVAPFLSSDQLQVANVDEKSQRLAEDKDRVFLVDCVGSEHRAAADAEIPEDHGNYAFSEAFTAEPLYDKATHENDLSHEAEDDPALIAHSFCPSLTADLVENVSAHQSLMCRGMRYVC